ncbi:SIMPL domain-containing protein [Falsiroseomonas selenitidurans]|uniref:SIMPL domain-containing protein n=1 Tax=Falsiroseomonas selenitidurans TaxID=2716335 RepID=A0ABX1E8I8_9PROT|nr:SIMPL domain-containing protein [Falsiroseomonas selenitidurans]NKC33356.1 SIMPL domain-containing protein [Falsiroseomonas selenitidurans]
MLHPIRALLLAPILLLAPAAQAQPAPQAPGLAETLLHIAETAEVTRAPDQVVAVLRAESRAGTAAAAQDSVNRAITAALSRAQAVPGVQVSTGGYWTGRVEEARAWQASQTLTLRGAAAPALLELAGALQGQGLAMQSLDWTLTRETTRLAREEASRLALEALGRRAAAVAAQLGLQVAGLQEVRIEAPDRGPRPMAMMARSASAAAPPVAVAEEAVVAASVAAIAVLRPR